jgi:hypothetical protein
MLDKGRRPRAAPGTPSATLRSLTESPNRAPALFPLPAEVVIAPSALHIEGVKAAIRPEVAVAVQDIHTAKVRRARAQSRRRGTAKCVRIHHPILPLPSPLRRRASAPTLALTPWTR